MASNKKRRQKAAAKIKEAKPTSDEKANLSIDEVITGQTSQKPKVAPWVRTTPPQNNSA
jgi:hypothetical protein